MVSSFKGDIGDTVPVYRDGTSLEPALKGSRVAHPLEHDSISQHAYNTFS